MQKITVKCNQTGEALEVRYLSDDDVPLWLDELEKSNRWGEAEKYSVEFEKTTLEKIEALQVLRETDWYIIRKLDPTGGEEIPKNILDARKAARDTLKSIESDIE